MFQLVRTLLVCGGLVTVGAYVFAAEEAAPHLVSNAVWVLKKLDVNAAPPITLDVGTTGKVSATNGLPSSSISGLAEDKDGAIWIVHGGLSRLVGDQLCNYSVQRQGKELFFATSPTVGASGLWFLPEGSEPIICRRTADGIELRQYENVVDADLGRLVSCIFVDSRGCTWWGGYRDSIWQVQDERVSLIQRCTSRHSSIVAIGESPSGQVLFGTTSASFYSFDPDDRWFPEEMRLPTLYYIDRLTSFCFDQLGNLYVAGMGQRVVRVEGILATRLLQTSDVVEVDDLVPKVNLDRNENVWICSTGEAICIHAPRYDKSTEYHFADSPIIRQVLVDSSGNYWAATNKGVLKNFHKMMGVTVEESHLPEVMRPRK